MVYVRVLRSLFNFFRNSRWKINDRNVPVRLRDKRITQLTVDNIIISPKNNNITGPYFVSKSTRQLCTLVRVQPHTNTHTVMAIIRQRGRINNIFVNVLKNLAIFLCNHRENGYIRQRSVIENVFTSSSGNIYGRPATRKLRIPNDFVAHIFDLGKY